MKTRKSLITLVIMVMVFTFCVSVPGYEVKALSTGSLSNVLKAPAPPSGSLVKNSKGKRYKLSNGKYVTKKWYKINGHYYYFTMSGYAKVGIMNYNGRNYAFDKYGHLIRGWKTIGGCKYYFWKAATRGAEAASAAVGRVTIAGEEYYFNEEGQMQTGWNKIGKYYYYFKPSTGVMVKNTKIDGYTINSAGRRVTTAAAGKVDYWVGDSRTVGLGAAVGISSKCIARVGEGYNWYCSTAEPLLISKLKSKPTATVVFNLGVNDIDNYNRYISRYNSLMKKYPKAKFYFLSINPLDYNKYKSPWVTDALVKKFNTALKAAYGQRYLDSYSLIKPYIHPGSTKYSSSSTDSAGLHYSNTIYKKIYNFVLTKV